MERLPRPRGNAIGEGKNSLSGTGLLNTAGEKIEGSGTLGQP